MRRIDAMSSNNVTASIEVVEANDDEAWAQWEDSVPFHDSQFPPDGSTLALATPGEDTSDVPDLLSMDPFASVTKNSG